MSNIVRGVLNDVYKAATERKALVMKSRKVGGIYGYTQSIWQRGDLKRPPALTTAASSVNRLGCCGISEFHFTRIQTDIAKKLSDAHFEELIAKYIEAGLYEDNRVYITGLPLKKTTRAASSRDLGAERRDDDPLAVYDFEFYERLYKTLLSFGFRLMADPYVNKNSNNQIVVLSVQKE